MSLHRSRLRHTLSSLSPAVRALLVITAVWAIILIAFAVMRHERLNSSTFDMGIKTQVIWNTYQGRLFGSSVEVEQYLGDHVQLIMLLLAPLYALWADAAVMLVVQSILLSAGAIPVYRIARRHLEDEKLALVFAAAYLLYPTIGFVNRFDFHPLTFVIFFLLAAYDLLEADKVRWASVFVLLALICREDVGFTVFAFGLYVALAMGRRRLGLIWAATGLAWSATTLLVIMPYFRGEAPDTFARYGWLGSTIPEMMRTLLTRPGYVLSHQLGDPLRQQFLLKLLLPVGFLALLAPTTLLVGLPALAYNLLSETPSQSSIYFQYISPVIPFLFVAAIRGTAWLQRRLAGSLARPKQRLLITAWLAISVLAAWLLDNPFTQTIDTPYFPVYALEQTTDRQPFDEASALLPPQAPLATMMAYGPHLSLRPQLYLFYDRLQLEQRPYGFPQTEYLLLNLTDLRWDVNARFFYAAIETAIGLYGYEALYFRDDVVLLAQTAAPQPQTGAVLQRVVALLEAGGKFAPAAPSTIAWMGRQWVREEVPPTAVAHLTSFASGIQLLGYEIPTKPLAAGRPLCAILYWQATDAPPPRSYTVFLHFAGPDGYVHAQRDRVPALGFYPIPTWQPGEIVADMHCLQIPPSLPAGTYRLHTGLYDPDSGDRLPITGEAAETTDGALLLTEITIAP